MEGNTFETFLFFSVDCTISHAILSSSIENVQKLMENEEEKVENLMTFETACVIFKCAFTTFFVFTLIVGNSHNCSLLIFTHSLQLFFVINLDVNYGMVSVFIFFYN